MEILKQTVRYEVFDKMKGLAMMLVIMGHTHILARPIWTFHMPLFFILAGYFFRPKSVTESLKKDARRLLLPVLFVMAVMVLYGAVMYAFTGDKDKMLPWLYGVMNILPFHLEPSVGIGPLWFLLAMYWCKNLFNMCHVLFKPAWGRWAAIAALVCLGLACKDKWNVCCMAVGMHAMLFYGMGYIWKQSKDKLDAMSDTSKWVVVLSAFALWLYCYSAADSFYELPSMTFPNGILLDSMAAFAMTFILYTLLSRIRFRGGILNTWCTNTMLIFCFHTIEMFFIPWQKAVGVIHFENDDYTNISVFLLRMAFSAICLYVVPKFRWGRYLFCIK